MSKIRIYIKPEQLKDSLLISEQDTVHKIKDVLRLKSTECIYVFDGCGREYLYFVKQVNKNSILIDKERLSRETSLNTKKITLGFPLEREERIDFILQKCTELGVFKFCPFISERSLKAKPSPNKFIRWQRIAAEAARQSQRLWIPQINEPVTLEDIDQPGFDLKFVGSLSGESLTKKIKKNFKNILIVIGPVGDFTENEYNRLKQRGFKAIKLSQNLLRTETAAAFSVGLVNYFLDEV